MNLTKYIGKLYILSIVSLIVSVLFRVYFSNSLVSANTQLSSLYLEKDLLQKEISRLTYVENELSALNIMEYRAANMGFVKMENNLLGLNINTTAAIAYNNN
jgi:cell division protein FtsL